MLLHPVENSPLKLPNRMSSQVSLIPKDRKRKRKGANNASELCKKTNLSSYVVLKGKDPDRNSSLPQDGRGGDLV